MGYTGIYSLGTRCLTEFLATFMAIGMGLGMIANELLPNTKGHAFGFGFIAFGFSMSFTAAICMFGYSSAHLNPAMVLSLWVRGKLDFTDFLALSASELAGGAAGALFIYLIYLPHFRTVPEARASNTDDLLLRTRDQIEPSALRFASYNTKPHYASKTTPDSKKTLAQRIADARYYLLNESFDEDPEGVVEHLIGGTYALHGAEVPFPTGKESLSRKASVPALEKGESSNTIVAAGGIKRRHSLQVADMQRLLRKFERELGGNEPSVHFDTTAGDLAIPARNASPEPEIEASGAAAGKGELAKINREEALGRAAIAADQATKLSVFATRPAIFLPIHNFLVEMLGTAFLIFGASMIDARLEMITDAGFKNGTMPTMAPLLIGLYIMVLILGLGGPTGFAANPARDFAPRLIHYILPIPGKGDSELWYGVIINVGALLGGALGAGMFMACNSIHN
ncbi:aquaporin-like protein [Obelidium mucronatum]|nr:aquaporin-like protein [Obelidium mucronatum]